MVGEHQRAGSEGFTLLEILIALTITATVMSVVFGVYASCLEVAGDIETSSQTDQMMRMVMSRISRDISSYAPVTTADFKAFRGKEKVGRPTNATASANGTQAAPQEVAMFVGKAWEDAVDEEDGVEIMSFPTRGTLDWVGTPWPGRINLVSYVLVPERDQQNPGTYILLRREQPFAGLYADQDTQEVELADGLLRVEDAGPLYLDKEGESFRKWDGAVRQQNKQSLVPAMVRWNIWVQRGGRPTMYTIAVHPLTQGVHP